ncbi:APC family permease [Burkholderia multivorans]|uniref:APC family permease n=1 Tax=Burkholderia multivorans TaxID=87883 RepID=UPI00057FF67A|nr:APC family permease [Burkholderia multivorans]KHS10111.1 Putrescine importer PuuP [Burkholderia multivorans]KHS14897.1 Putrescine importer PuuP [Burkholderia multivorans]MBR7925218.1 APC family permease [Burkholderia multivorans]MBR8242578.1 APC family permease [Burkholderia multivorans]MBU9429272.1 APC family permease [Burkholderia multivorans]
MTDSTSARRAPHAAFDDSASDADARDAFASRHARPLGLFTLVIFGLAYMLPMTVFTTYGLVTRETNGHLVAAYAVTLIAMLFTARSYGHMTRLMPSAGSAYTFASRNFGTSAGFMVGWALLMDYLFIPMISYLAIGIYMKQIVPAVPPAVWIVASIAFITALNVIGIRLVNRVNLILIASQLVFIAVFLVAAARAAGGDALPTTIALPATEDAHAIFSGAAILCLSFLGFDAVSTLSEETREPRRTVPRAILLCTLASGVLFMLIAYAGQAAFPDWHAFRDLDSASLELMRHIGGGALSAFFVAVYVAGCFASAMAGQASVTRVLFAMGRDRVLPECVFGRLHVRLRTPVRATLAVGAVSLSALFITLDLASTMISFGALVAFAVVNLCVMRSYLSRPEHRTAAGWIRFGAMPAIGFALNVWLWSGLSRQTFYVGIAWLALGLAQLVWLTRGFTRPAPTLTMN